MPEALVVDIQLAAPPPGSREQLVDCPPPPGSRAAKLARLKELRAKYGHINSDAAAPPVTSPVRRAEPAVTFEPQSPSRPLVAGGLRWTLAPAGLSLEAPHRRYRRLRQIGRGRFGEVYLCAELRTARLLVMKSVNAQCVDAPARQEIDVLLRLRKHPNIIKLHDVFADGPERLALVMEYADGGDLGQRLERAAADGRPMAAAEVEHVFVQVALALQHCHRHLVVHRDLKPANVLLTQQGIVRLGDFGIAREMLPSAAAVPLQGTPLYMAPEVLRGQPAGKAADVWSLGVVLYQMAADEHSLPWNAPSLPQLVRMICVEPPPPLPPPPRCPAHLAELALALLRKRPHERCALATALARPELQTTVRRCHKRVLARSLERETRIHEAIDDDETAEEQPSLAGRVSSWTAADVEASRTTLANFTPQRASQPERKAERMTGGVAPRLLKGHSAIEGNAAAGVESLRRLAKWQNVQVASDELPPTRKVTSTSRSRKRSLRIGGGAAAEASGSRTSPDRASEERTTGSLASKSSRSTLPSRLASTSENSSCCSPPPAVSEGSWPTPASRQTTGASSPAPPSALQSVQSGKMLTMGSGELTISTKDVGVAVDGNGDAEPTSPGAKLWYSLRSPAGKHHAEMRQLRHAARAARPFGSLVRESLADHALPPRTPEPSRTTRAAADDDVRDSVSLRSYACTDADGKAGQLWIGDLHVCFSAAGGARVAVHVRRIRTIVLLDKPPPPPEAAGCGSALLRLWRRRRAGVGVGWRAAVGAEGIRLELTGEPAHAEAFYGLADREQTVGDIMRQVARNGADPPALLREGERVRSPSLLDLATNLLNRRTQED